MSTTHNRIMKRLDWMLEHSGRVTLYVLVSLALLVLTAPILVVTLISFNPTRTQYFPPSGISLRWYAEFFQTDYFVHSFFVVSLPIALVSALIATVLGGAAAYAIVRQDIPYKNLIQSFLLIPIMIPGVIIGFALLLTYGKVNLDAGYPRLILAHSVRLIPYALLTTMASLYSFDDDLIRAARGLGANRYEAFYKVTFPIIKSGVIAGFLLSFIISFANVNISLFLVRPGVTPLPVEIFSFLKFRTSPIIAAISTIQIFLILVLVLIIQRLAGFESVYN